MKHTLSICMLCTTVILAIISSFSHAEPNPIRFTPTRAANLTLQELHNCKGVKCNLDLECPKRNSALTYLNSSSCCPECSCNPCPKLDLSICTVGFKPFRQPRNEDEDCCDKVVCISESADDTEDLVLKIISKSQKKVINDEVDQRISKSRHADADATQSKLFSPHTFLHSLNTKQDISLSVEEKNEEEIEELSDENDYYLDDLDQKKINKNNIESNLCAHLNCSDEKFSYFKQNSKCPEDSVAEQLSEIDQHCCRVTNACECKKCEESESKMVDKCMSNGENFRPILAQKGESLPGKCCNFFICHSSNITCNLNNVFYQHKAEWKVNPCTVCKCNMGQISCNKIQCPQLKCEIRKSIQNECCPVCTNECRSTIGSVIKSGETWREDNDCTVCRCTDGIKSCMSESCELVHCKNPKKTPEKCCPVCEMPAENVIKPKFLKYPPYCKSKVELIRSCKNLTCKYGIKLDGNRCPECSCAEKPIEKCEFACDYDDLAYVPLNDRLCKCTRSCHESSSSSSKVCEKKCEHGLELDNNGCKICKCKEPVVVDQTECFNQETGFKVSDGNMWFDGCRECSCIKGKQYCTLITCQKPNCAKPVYVKNQCCPSCSIEELEEKNVNAKNTSICISPKDKKIHFENDSWKLDACTHCTCRNGLVMCDINQCPPVTCAKPIFDKKNSCCPRCNVPALNGKEKSNFLQTNISALSNKYWSCVDFDNKIRPHMSNWKANDCLHCSCNNGERVCFNNAEKCAKLLCEHQILKKGECCPYCFDEFSSEIVLPNKQNNTLTNFKMLNSFTIKLLASFCAVLILFVIILLVIIYRYQIKSSSNSIQNESRHLKSKMFTKSSQPSIYGNKSTVIENVNESKEETAATPLLVSKFNFNNNKNLLLNTTGSEKSDSFNEDLSKSTLNTSLEDNNIIINKNSKNNKYVKLAISKGSPNVPTTYIYYC